MSDSVEYYFNENFGEENKQPKIPIDIQQLLDTYKLLSIENKVLFKRIIKEESIF